MCGHRIGGPGGSNTRPVMRPAEAYGNGSGRGA